jgi:hypothetical protein
LKHEFLLKNIAACVLKAGIFKPAGTAVARELLCKHRKQQFFITKIYQLTLYRENQLFILRIITNSMELSPF